MRTATVSRTEEPHRRRDRGSGRGVDPALTAFQPSRVQVTALGGWPAGRTPKDVVTQGTHAHGYVRRAWKPAPTNDGTYMDFQAGWRKTSAAGTIRIRLDNNASSTSATRSRIRSPRLAPAARRARSTRLGGGNFTTWSAAIAGCARQRRAGGAGSRRDRCQRRRQLGLPDRQQHDVTSTASGVKVVAHPDDLAAGRRPRIHRWGTKFARFADDLNNGHWELDPNSPGGGNLGSPHGTVWRSVATFTNPDRYGVGYRTASGGIRRLWIYTNTNSTSIAMGRLRDKTYPRIAIDASYSGGAGDPTDISSWVLYMGPGIHWNSNDSKFYIRLSPLKVHGTTVVGAKQINPSGTDNPAIPWNWSRR